MVFLGDRKVLPISKINRQKYRHHRTFQLLHYYALTHSRILYFHLARRELRYHRQPLDSVSHYFYFDLLPNVFPSGHLPDTMHTTFRYPSSIYFLFAYPTHGHLQTTFLNNIPIRYYGDFIDLMKIFSPFDPTHFVSHFIFTDRI